MKPVVKKTNTELSKFEVETYIRAAKSAATRRTYRAAIKNYTEWGGKLPANTSDLIEYVAEKAQQLVPNTIKLYLTAISQWHLTQQFDDPTDSPELRGVMKGVQRIHGTPQQKASAFTDDDIYKVCKTWMDGTIKQVRDAAMLSVGFFGAFRRSEITRMRYHDLKFCSRGLTITLPRSKTDTTGKGIITGIPAGEGDHCPLLPLLTWINRAGIHDGPLFRKIGRHGGVSRHGLSDSSDGRTVALIAKNAAILLGYDPTSYSGHSLRRGLATSAAEAGAERHMIKNQGGWKSDRMVEEYIDQGSIFNQNAVNVLLEKRNG